MAFLIDMLEVVDFWHWIGGWEFGVGVGGLDTPFDWKICLAFDFDKEFEAREWLDYDLVVATIGGSRESLKWI